ncbi:MAG TPA: hypothetical protein DEF21_14960 [Thalassospira lucentensis]|uniref:Uncharacterized protein n=1 Tax=Thalassospira lucentensis TaxID=168935 RepID=A0A358HVH6_9PROT|nr:hypothetical protein [Thalassospira lucentensis]HCW66061.1 hypothetical protein [Thalassospira lucentensis]
MFHIVGDHWATLKNVDGEASYIDFAILYVLPAVIASVAFLDVWPKDNSIYGVSISVFAIFSALLLNVQIAIFGIFQRKWRSTGDKVKDEKAKRKYISRKILLSQLNTNISYLIIISCLSVTVFLVFYVYPINSFSERYISVYVYVHFLLTLMMVIKRTHVLFQNEYSVDEGMLGSS